MLQDDDLYALEKVWHIDLAGNVRRSFKMKESFYLSPDIRQSLQCTEESAFRVVAILHRGEEREDKVMDDEQSCDILRRVGIVMPQMRK